MSEYRDRRRAGSPNCLRCFILGGAKSVVSDRGWTRRLLPKPAAPAKGALETGKEKSFSSVGKKIVGQTRHMVANKSECNDCFFMHALTPQNCAGSLGVQSRVRAS